MKIKWIDKVWNENFYNKSEKIEALGKTKLEVLH